MTGVRFESKDDDVVTAAISVNKNPQLKEMLAGLTKGEADVLMTIVQADNLLARITILDGSETVKQPLIQLLGDVVNRAIGYMIDEWHIPEKRFDELSDKAEQFVTAAHFIAQKAFDERSKGAEGAEEPAADTGEAA